MKSRFELFRVKVQKKSQSSLLRSKMPNAEILAKAVGEHPSLSFRSDYKWHLGNVEAFGSHRYFFVIGREAPTALEHYDDRSKDFNTQEVDAATTSYVALDSELGLAAIQRNSQLAPKAVNLAGKLESLLNESKISRDQAVRIEVAQIADPTDLLTVLSTAYNITRFSMTVRKPNPIDADDFQKPFERLVEKVNGDKGRAILEGRNLASEPIRDLARATAASGETAEARVKRTKNSRAVRWSLGNNPVVIEHEIETDEEKQSLFSRIRDKYTKVRYPEKKESL